MIESPSLLLTSVAVVLGVAPAALAQQPDSAVLPRVVITATRAEAPVAGDVFPTSVVDGETLRRLGVHDVGEALRLLPGMAVVRSGGLGAQTSLFLRGGESDFVRVLVDGTPVNDPGGAIDLGWLAVDNVERIEVVRGPASVLYGSDAVTGVVQIFTRAGEGSASGDARTEAGRYGSARLEASARGGNKWVGASLGAARGRTDGALAFNNAYSNDAASARLWMEPGSATRLTLAIRRFSDEFHYPTDGAGRVVDRNAFRADQRTVFSGELRQRLAPRLTATLGMASLAAHGRVDDGADGPADTVGFHAYQSLSALQRRQAEARLEFAASPRTVMVVGGEWIRESQHSEDSSNFDAGRNRFRALRSNNGIFGQLLAERGRVSLSAGARHDDGDAFGSFRTARLALAVQTWRGGGIRAAVGNAFKSPTLHETFSTAFSTGNPALRPERSRSWELGVRQELAGGAARLAATWFDQRFRNLIQYTFLAPGLPNYFNVAAASARGIEIEVDAQLTPRLRASLASSLLRSRVDDSGYDSGRDATFVLGQRLLRRPAEQTKLTLAAQANSSMSFDLVMMHTGARDDRDFSDFPAVPVVLDEYTRVDFSVWRELSAPGDRAAIRLGARLGNLLGAGYQEVANFPALGRSLHVTLAVAGGR